MMRETPALWCCHSFTRHSFSPGLSVTNGLPLHIQYPVQYRSLHTPSQRDHLDQTFHHAASEEVRPQIARQHQLNHITHSLPTPNNPDAVGYTFYGSAEIDCPPTRAWEVLTDWSNYARWNTFTPSVKWPMTPPEPGATGRLEYHWTPEAKLSPQPIRLIAVEDGARTVSWTGIGMPSWLLLPERVQRVDELPDGGCRFTSYETMRGPLSHIIYWFLGSKLDAANRQTANDLKRWVEGGQS